MPANNPLHCSFCAMVERGSSEVVLLDTGNYPGYSNYLNQTWTWDGSDWTRQGSGVVDGAGPLPGRNNFAMTYDGYNVVMFGGAADHGDGVQSDTWTWDGAAWTKEAPATVPFGRFKAMMAFLNLPGAQKAVMFGGTNLLNVLSETWNWDGDAGTWTLAAPAHVPPARMDHAFSGGTTSCVLFGGKGTAELLGDTWRWDGSDWTQLTPTTPPSARAEACLAFDTANNEWVLFGGRDNAGVLVAETWTLNAAGTAWTKKAPATSPNGRVGAHMCYDAQNGSILLVGGTNGFDAAYNDTWRWNGTTWTQL